MNCDRVRALGSAYLYGVRSISTELERNIQTHLGACPGCTQYLKDQLALTCQVELALQQVPSEQLEVKILRYIQRRMAQRRLIKVFALSICTAAVILIGLISSMLPLQGPQLFEELSVPWELFPDQPLVLAEGILMYATPHSKFQVDPGRVVILTIGELWIELGENSKERLTVKTPLGEVVAEGTQFIVQVHPDRIGLLTLSGGIRFRPVDGDPIRVTQGEYLLFRRGSPPCKGISSQRPPRARLALMQEVWDGWRLFKRPCEGSDPDTYFCNYTAKLRADNTICVLGDGFETYAGIQRHLPGTDHRDKLNISFRYKASGYPIDTPATNVHLFITDLSGNRIYYHKVLQEGGVSEWRKFSGQFDLSVLEDNGIKVILCLKDTSKDDSHQINLYKGIRIEVSRAKH